MSSARTELMQFKVSPKERGLIEKCAKKQDMSVSEYVRGCLLMEMVLDGEIEAMRIVAASIGRHAIKTLQKRAKQLSAMGEEPETVR